MNSRPRRDGSRPLRPFDFLWVFAATLPLTLSFFNTIEGDIRGYFLVMDDWRTGNLPYRDHVFEYPPYAFLLLAFPALGHSFESFRSLFLIELFAIDVAVKVLLLRAGRAAKTGLRAWVPFLVFSACTVAQEYLYLKRLDLGASALVAFAAVALCSRRFGWAGFFLALAIPVKLYPLVLAPVFLAVAASNGGLRRLVAGGVAGLSPLVFFGLYVPWWAFASFHTGRGLQAESLWASLLWLGHFFADVGVEWTNHQWIELTGRPAEVALRWGQGVWVLSTLFSSGLGAYSLWRSPLPTLPRFARVALVPVLAFVAFNYVLSPQFLIWLSPLVALGFLEGRRWPVVALAIAIGISFVVFPSPSYASGLDLPRTFVLAARNLLLVVGWAALLAEAASTRAVARAGSALARPPA